MKARVVIVNIAGCEKLLECPERFCSEGRLFSAARIADEKKRLQSYAAELALSYALSGDALLPPEYRRLENGMPVCDSGFISLSHTEGFAAAVVSDMPCGIDIELRREVSPAALHRLLAPAELSLPEGELLPRFVTKEAFLKMTGAGVFGGADRVYETGGRVFLRGVLAGFASSFDSAEYFCRLVTARRALVSPVSLKSPDLPAFSEVP